MISILYAFNEDNAKNQGQITGSSRLQRVRLETEHT